MVLLFFQDNSCHARSPVPALLFIAGTAAVARRKLCCAIDSFNRLASKTPAYIKTSGGHFAILKCTTAKLACKGLSEMETAKWEEHHDLLEKLKHSSSQWVYNVRKSNQGTMPGTALWGSGTGFTQRSTDMLRHRSCEELQAVSLTPNRGTMFTLAVTPHSSCWCLFCCWQYAQSTLSFSCTLPAK